LTSLFGVDISVVEKKTLIVKERNTSDRFSQVGPAMSVLLFEGKPITSVCIGGCIAAGSDDATL
jgi:hypothetical protein